MMMMLFGFEGSEYEIGCICFSYLSVCLQSRFYIHHFQIVCDDK